MTRTEFEFIFKGTVATEAVNSSHHLTNYQQILEALLTDEISEHSQE